MKKFLALAIMSILLFPNFTNARTHTIVEKDTYGSGLYSSGVMHGNFLFVNMSRSRIDILDLSDTSNVTLFSTLEVPCTVYDIAIDGNVLAAGCSQFIHFYNVSDVANPVSVGVYDNGGVTLNEYIFENNHLYLANDSSEIIIFDTTDTNNLVELSRIELDFYNRIRLDKAGDYLYTVQGYDFAGIYDVSDANNIKLVSEYEDPTRQIFDVTVIDETLYLSHADGIQVVDITTPSNPIFIKDHFPTPNTGTFGRPWSLISEGNHIFIGTHEGEVAQLDLSDPLNPVDLTFHNISGYWINELVMFGQKLLTFSGHGGLSLADYSETGNVLPLDGFNQSLRPFDIAIENNRVVTTNHGGGYHLLELDDDLGIREITRIEEVNARGEAALNGDTAWLGSFSGIETYDFTNYQSPVQTDSLPTISSGVTLLDGSTLYIGDYFGDVLLYDVSSGFPVFVSSVSLGIDPETGRQRTIKSIKPYGDYLLIATLYDDLVIVDKSNLNDIIEIGTYSLASGNNPQLEVVGSTLYLTKSSGLFLVDLTDVNNPIPLGSRGNYGVLRAIERVEESNGVLISGSDLFYLDTSDEVNPVEVHSVESEDFLTGMAYHNGKIAAASSTKSRIKSFQLNFAPDSSDSSVTAFANATFNGQLDSSDPEGDSVTFTIDTNVTNGTLVINDDGSFDYTPTTDFIGEDSFQYTAEDEHGGSSSATVSITVESGYDHVFNATVDTMFFGQVTETGLEGDEFKFKILVKPANGKIVFKSSGKFKYLANPGFIGEDTFEYAASNGTDFSDNKTVKINVNSLD